ncbi:zf-CCHC domain-containing protein [Tanacetum coccineum]
MNNLLSLKKNLLIAVFLDLTLLLLVLKHLMKVSSKNYVMEFHRALHPKWRAKDSEIYKEYAMVIRNFKKFFRRKGRFVRQPQEEKKPFWRRDDKKGKRDRKCFRCSDLNHLIDECPKPPRNKDQKAFVGGSWSDSENEVEDKTNDETCLMAQSSNEVTLDSSHFSDNASSFDDVCKLSMITDCTRSGGVSWKGLKGQKEAKTAKTDKKRKRQEQE